MTPPILTTSRPSISVLDYKRNELLNLLTEKIRSHPGVTSAYVFGSLATGNASAWSDIDVIIITETDVAFIERPRAFWDLLDIGLPLDILVYTPAEFAEIRTSNTSFWKHFQENHIKLL